MPHCSLRRPTLIRVRGSLLRKARIFERFHGERRNGSGATGGRCVSVDGRPIRSKQNSNWMPRPGP